MALVHQPTLEAVPEIEAPLNDLASLLDSTETMRELIARVDDDGEDPSTVATAFRGGTVTTRKVPTTITQQ